jgi:hypothetical protein
MKRSLVCLVLGCATVVYAGCKRSDRATSRRVESKKALTIRDIEVVDRSLPDDRLVKKAAVIEHVKRRLNKGPFVFDGQKSKERKESKKSTTDYRLKLIFGSGERVEKDEKKQFVAMASVRVTADEEGGESFEFSGVSPATASMTKAEKKKRLLRIIDKVIAEVAAQAELLRAGDDALLAAFDKTENAEPERLVFIVELVARRKLKKAVPKLIVLLKHRDRRVADRSIGALMRLRAREAIKPLTRLAKFRDARRLAQVIDAIAAIGGEEAKQFLEFVAEGHAHPVIRNQARAALASMKATNPVAPSKKP